MIRATKFLMAIALILTSCSSVKPDIDAVCEDLGNSRYIVKWELRPDDIKGNVKIYVSEEADNFNLQNPPAALCPISDKICEIDLAGRPNVRYYFLLRFKNKYDYHVATRAPHVKDGSNFRDLGGYRTPDGQVIKWGYIYRSGELDEISSAGLEKFRSLQVKTWIDFRDEARYTLPDTLLGIESSHHFPINLIATSPIFDRLKNETLRRGDANLFMQDLFLQLINEGKYAFSQMFDLLCDDANYPIVLGDKFGKDYVGFASALVLAALNIPEETIYRDYILSNQYLDRCAIHIDHTTCSTDTQEAATALMTVRKRQLFCAIRRIKQRHGSVLQYLQNEIGLTPEKQAKIQAILLK